MRLIVRCVAAALLICGTVSAAAEPREISVKANAKFKHKQTGISLPPAVGHLSRVRVAELEPNGLDVLIDYRSSDDREVTTIFLYRNVVGDVPLWFDRASRIIEKNPRLGEIDATIPAAPFTPPGQSSASGLRAAYSVKSNQATSTALAVLPVGEFYVKLRLSSATLDPAQLHARMLETLSAIEWPRKLAAQPQAVPIAECESALIFTGKAQPAPPDGAAALMGALMPAVADGLAKGGIEKAAAPHWCRDARVMENASLYRPNGDTERYLVAFQDAGRGIIAGHNSLASLLGSEQGENAKPRYSVELILLGENRGFGDFLSLPSPEQAVELLSTSEPIYSTLTVGKKNQISINSDALGE